LFLGRARAGAPTESVIMGDEVNIARALAPEDVRPGDYVAVLQVVTERMLESWECECAADATRLVRVAHLPDGDTAPMHVLEVCLPFVLVKTAGGRNGLIDVRRLRLARVSARFGRRVFQQFAAERRTPKDDGGGENA